LNGGRLTNLFSTFFITEPFFDVDTDSVNICIDGEISFVLSFEHIILCGFCFRFPWRIFSGSGMMIDFFILVFEHDILCKFDFFRSNLGCSIFWLMSVDNLSNVSAFTECVSKLCIRSPPGPCFLIIDDCLDIVVFD